MIKHLTLFLIIAVCWGCEQPVQVIVDTVAVDSLIVENDSLRGIIDTLTIIIEGVPEFLSYDVSPSVRAIQVVSGDWNLWQAVVGGLFINTGDDIIQNVAMQLTLRDIDNKVIEVAVGYFTLNEVRLELSDEYPYTKEFNLIPGKTYSFYAQTRPMTYSVFSVTWWFTPIIEIDEPVQANPNS